MKNTIITLLVLTLAMSAGVFLIAACGGGGGGSDVTALEGFWETNCVEREGTWSLIQSFSFSGGDFVDTRTVWNSETDCTGSVGTLIREGTFSIGDTFQCDSLVQCVELDLNYVTAPAHMDYNIYHTDGGTLLLGDFFTGDGQVPLNRPTDVDDSLVLYLQ